MKLNTNRGNKEEQKKVLGDIDFDANLPDFSELDEADLEGENFDFFVDGYNDEQI